MVTSLGPNTYDHSMKLAIILTDKLARQETIIKKKEATKAKDKKRKHDGNSMRTWTQASKKEKLQENLCCTEHYTKVTPRK